ncbi:DUF4184 family protein [Tenacibaculum finnmarkense]|uniref:DUF4184 family protein n=1 Tax=Tenacibaculum finnmarkense TaxID=2781243 RepID=UPI000C442CDC|nr:DUF4184 family protein [Tenacibaculum finnmarkense]MCD8403511.1 DUF4184 family protein [Tenacibaculum finnmarkense genomovar finnmarkense]MCD8439695.1 DUF4184 family protein [Tenacibaculum finnmarkense genomovar ulcerans]MCD8447877.1 DUF4184 family protein [Tenacibaculum finnmarkense genomovar finnmarkense]MCD8454748.1 DUF4184 family protein [Tenacibaculum finnmarkense genomovar ulcerans]MCG8720543.1 DUF4184 family protein [Tenacibaculum finnmarkense]
MPFTFSHPAIVLPLKNIFGKWISLTAIIIGSLTPDFEYFLRMKIQSNFSHTILGTLWFNLPLGLLLCFIFHLIIKTPLLENLPKYIQARTTDLKDLNWNNYFIKNWFIVCLSILIGAYSHIFWDSFTHQNTFFTGYFQLNEKILNSPISYFKILQHLSTLLGGLFIIWSFNKREKQNLIESKPNSTYWIAVSLVAIAILIIRFSSGLKITAYGNIIVSSITAIMIAITIVSFLFLNKKEISL